MTESGAEFDGIEVETGESPQFAVIWLHGLGADGGDFVPVVPELDLPVATRFLFPHAPIRPVTINGGYPMRAWYDIFSFDRGSGEDSAGIEQSAAQLRQWVQREGQRGIPTENVVLAGFSQGGAIVLHTALTCDNRYAGVMALSTYLPMLDSTLAQPNINTDTPVWMAHGSHDPVIDLGTAERSRAAMTRAGVDVDWTVYSMPHALCPEEIRAIAAWLQGLQRNAATTGA